MLSIYQLKPAFQGILRPLVVRLATTGITANSVTLAAMVLSLGLGTLLCLAGPTHSQLFLLLPLWMFLRMALNAIDGMLAREFDQKTPLGAYLNELSDVVSDAALYLPFAFVAPFGGVSIGLLIFLSAVSEMAGALGPMVGAPRQYDGPLGKSDRAFLFGTLGLWLGLAGQLPEIAFWLLPAAWAGIVLNTINRIHSGIAASKP
ncbi:MAG: CDP-alcohol phosphatidyltransferase protein [Proteobacteria bacterium]|nr:CDP-alcohol phosphatidyltransferase protein [Pseudomonadota bacterium]